jgi:hypothetical protein
LLRYELRIALELRLGIIDFILLAGKILTLTLIATLNLDPNLQRIQGYLLFLSLNYSMRSYQFQQQSTVTIQ